MSIQSINVYKENNRYRVTMIMLKKYLTCISCIFCSKILYQIYACPEELQKIQLKIETLGYNTNLKNHFITYCSISLGYHNETPQTGGLNSRKLFSHNTKIKVPARLVSPYTSFLGLQRAPSSWCPHMASLHRHSRWLFPF